MDHKVRKSKQTCTFRDMYKDTPKNISYFTFKTVLDTMCSVILEHVLMRSEGFKMPFGLGFIQIGKYKPKLKGQTKKAIAKDETKLQTFLPTLYSGNRLYSWN